MVSGHADYSKKGSDIVCSAVSFFVRSFLRAFASENLLVSDKTKIGKNEIVFELDIKSFSKQTINKTNSKVDVLLLGFRDIVKEYPENVELIIKET